MPQVAGSGTATERLSISNEFEVEMNWIERNAAESLPVSVK